MKKKLSLMLCLMFMVLGLAACGTDPKSVDYYGMSYSDLQSNMEQVVSTLGSMSEEDRTYIGTYGTDVSKKLITSWDETVSELGEYQGTGEFSIAKAQNTLTLEQTAVFSERDACVTYVYSYNYEAEQLELTDANVDKVYTLKEKMSKAGMNTLMGMGTVFTVLILISLIIYCFNVIPYLQKRKEGRKTQTAAVEQAVVTQIEQREEQQLTDDLELVAVISAAIAAGTGTPVEGFVVRSIHRR